MQLGLDLGLAPVPVPEMKTKRILTERQIFSRSRVWKRARKECLRLYQGCCGYCGRDARDVHHIKPYWKYPELRLVQSNLIPLCFDCHWIEHPGRIL